MYVYYGIVLFVGQDFRLSGLETAEEERQIRRDKYYNDGNRGS